MAAPTGYVYAQVQEPPRLTGFVPAVAPPDARQIDAVVGLVITVGADGAVTDVTVATPAGHGLDEAAASAARQFVFAPATRDGVAMAARVRYDYAFHAEAPPAGRLEGRILDGTAAAVAVEVVVAAADGSEVGRVLTDELGGFALPDLPPGSYRVRVAALDAAPIDVVEEVRAGEATSLTYRLARRADRAAAGFGATARVAAPEREVTRRSIAHEELDSTAGTRGDALRTLELLPGVARPPGGSGMLIVRGSAPEDSQLFVDGAQVLRIYHFGGLTSFAPARLIDRLDLFPGSFSVRYGRATGGVVEMRMRDPMDDRLHAAADVSLIDASLFAETPLGAGWSLAAGVRRSTIDLWFGAAAGDAATITAAPVYLDYQLLLAHRSPRDKLRLQIYGSDDKLGLVLEPTDQDPSLRGALEQTSDFHRAQLVWQHRYTDATEHDVTMTLGTFGFGLELGPEVSQDIRAFDVLGRAEWRTRVAPWLRLTGGADLMLQAGNIRYRGPVTQQYEGNPELMGVELGDKPMTSIDRFGTFFRPALYLEAAVRPVPRLEVTAGARVDYFGEIERVAFDPRLSARLLVGAGTTLKAALGLFSQPPDYGEAVAGLGNPDLAAERAVHASAGVEQQLGKRASVGLELYAKSLSSLVTGGMDGGLTNDGNGRIYGAEVAGRLQPGGRLSGFLSYSLSRSERQDADGSWRLFDFDQTHVLTASMSLRLGRGWTAGGTGRLVSGNLQTPVTGSVYDANRDRYVPRYGATNSEREPLYTQLDLRIEKKFRVGRGAIAAYLDLQNATNAKNQEAVRYSYDYRTRGAVYGLPILPAIGVRGDL